MRYFKVTIQYEFAPTGAPAQSAEEVLHCCTIENFPKTEQLRELYASLYGPARNYTSAHWREVREEELPSEGAHLI